MFGLSGSWLKFLYGLLSILLIRQTLHPKEYRSTEGTPHQNQANQDKMTEDAIYMKNLATLLSFYGNKVQPDTRAEDVVRR